MWPGAVSHAPARHVGENGIHGTDNTTSSTHAAQTGAYPGHPRPRRRVSCVSPTKPGGRSLPQWGRLRMPLNMPPPLRGAKADKPEPCIGPGLARWRGSRGLPEAPPVLPRGPSTPSPRPDNSKTGEPKSRGRRYLQVPQSQKLPVDGRDQEGRPHGLTGGAGGGGGLGVYVRPISESRRGSSFGPLTSFSPSLGALHVPPVVLTVSPTTRPHVTVHTSPYGRAGAGGVLQGCGSAAPRGDCPPPPRLLQGYSRSTSTDTRFGTCIFCPDNPLFCPVITANSRMFGLCTRARVRPCAGGLHLLRPAPRVCGLQGPPEVCPVEAVLWDGGRPPSSPQNRGSVSETEVRIGGGAGAGRG